MGRKLVIGLLLTMFALVGFIFWIGATGGGTANLPPPEKGGRPGLPSTSQADGATKAP